MNVWRHQHKFLPELRAKLLKSDWCRAKIRGTLFLKKNCIPFLGIKELLIRTQLVFCSDFTFIQCTSKGKKRIGSGRSMEVSVS